MTDGASDRAPGSATGATSFGLFVIWPIGRSSAGAILDDLVHRFEVLDLIEVTWSDHLVRRNYERFYSDLDVAGVYHELNKGRGRFLTVVVRDDSPVFETRQTTRGVRPVSANFVDAKLHYRNELGNMSVHCGENEWESTRDLAVLLGLTPSELAAAEPIDGLEAATSIHRDPTGADGWSSVNEMLTFLNPIVPYVAIGGPDPPDGPIQLMTSEPHALHTVIDGRPVHGHPRPVGGRFLVTIAGRAVPLDIRPVTSGFVDEGWARAVLDDRRPDEDGILRAPPEDDLAIRAYLAVTRRRRLSAADLRTVRTLSQVPAATGGSAHAVTALADPDHPETGVDVGRDPELDRRAANEIVTRYLDRHDYRFVQPLDPTIIVHRPDDTAAVVAGRHLRVGLATVWIRTRGHGLALYLRARTWTMVRLPGLRVRWRRWRYGE
jgi:hypothetical protein